MLAEQLVDLTQGRGGEPYFSRALGMRDEVRAKLASQLGAEPSQVSLTRSTTDGCNIVLAGLDLGPEDEVVTSDVEHFGLIGPAPRVRRARRHGARGQDRRGGHRPDAPDRDLARLVGDAATRSSPSACKAETGCRSSSTARSRPA